MRDACLQMRSSAARTSRCSARLRVDRRARAMLLRAIRAISRTRTSKHFDIMSHGHRSTAWRLAGAIMLLGAVVSPARASDNGAEFAKGTTILGIQGGGGGQVNFNDQAISDISFLTFTPRQSYLPLSPFASFWIM